MVTARSGQDVKLMHAAGSSLGSVNSDSLYQCNVCRVLLKLEWADTSALLDVKCFTLNCVFGEA